MTDVYGWKDGQPISWWHKKPSRSNQYCPYCSTHVGNDAQVASNKEHLIARNFVPSGYITDRSFNFIFRSCEACNLEKAEAERSVSTVTLLTSPARLDDPRLDEIARHKASRDYHPSKKGTLVQDAYEDFELKYEEGGFKSSFRIVGPPLMNSDHIYLLARRHVQALLALIMTQDPTVRETTRIVPADHVFCDGAYSSKDWGNAHLQALLERVALWPCRLSVCTARGHFKAILRRSQKDSSSWFWAVEWNQELRVVGAIGRPPHWPDVLDDLPELQWSPLPDGGRMRIMVPLDQGTDQLFNPLDL
jgi:hypothetical protein